MGVFKDTQTVAIYGCYVGVAYCLALAVYNLALHPLRKYPGPFFAKITDAYLGWNSIWKRNHLASYENHAKYGSVVRLAPDRLIFNTVTALHDVYNNPNVTKSFVYAVARVLPIANVFDTCDVEEHRRKRKIIAQPISEKSMRTFEPVLAAQVHTFARQLLAASRRSEPVNMTHRFEMLGGDVAGHLGFGHDLRLQTRVQHQWLMRSLALNGARSALYHSWPLLHHLFNPLLSVLARPVRERYRAVIEGMIRERVAQPKDARPDLYSYAVDSMGGDSGSGVRGNELWSEAVFFIVAGGATTATSMAALTFYLSRYPECCARLRDEVRANFPSGRDIRAGPQLQACRYLRACINEALRMSPAAPGMQWREQLPPGKSAAKEDAPWIVDGHVIPRGTQVAVNIYAIHHNEEYFPDPFVFRPERWLTPEAEDPTSPMRRAFCPFLIGARACAGKAVAYLEMSLALASTVFYFDLEPAQGELGRVGAGVEGKSGGRGRVDEFQLYEIFGATHDGPYLMLKEREGFTEDLEFD